MQLRMSCSKKNSRIFLEVISRGIVVHGADFRVSRNLRSARRFPIRDLLKSTKGFPKICVVVLVVFWLWIVATVIEYEGTHLHFSNFSFVNFQRVSTHKALASPPSKHNQTQEQHKHEEDKKLSRHVLGGGIWRKPFSGWSHCQVYHLEG